MSVAIPPAAPFGIELQVAVAHRRGAQTGPGGAQRRPTQVRVQQDAGCVDDGA